MTTSHVQAIIDKIFSYDASGGIDKAALLARYDQSAALAAIKSGFRRQRGQAPQTGTVISSLPATISQPGNYTLSGNLTWTATVDAAAITITCSNVTLDLGGNTLTAVVQDKSQPVAGIYAGNAPEMIQNVTISNGILRDMGCYGICAEGVDNLTVQNITVDGLGFSNLTIRNACPAGIHVDTGSNVTIAGCVVQRMDVTSDSSAGIQILHMTGGQVSDCKVRLITNHDGSAQGYSYIASRQINTTNCHADMLITHFNGNAETMGHTCIGFVPMFCIELAFDGCSASNITGCCDDAHGMSVFIDAVVVVTNFTAIGVIDGAEGYNTGAKATGLEVYGFAVEIANCNVSNIMAIVPQDRQGAGFSAWGAGIKFVGCNATNVNVVDQYRNPDTTLGYGVGYGWAPDPRPYFNFGVRNVEYQDCTATKCQVGFDSWYHINSIWENITCTDCVTDILKSYGGQRTITGNICSECNPPISVTLTNVASDNTFPPG